MNVIKPTLALYGLLMTLEAHAACVATITQQAPDHRYTQVLDISTQTRTAIVDDNRTGLTWKACAEDGTDATACATTPAQITGWQAALMLTDGLTYESQTGWRLPTVKELLSLVDQACTNPAFNDTVFTNLANGNYYTSSADQSTAGNVWTVNLSTGDVTSSSQSTNAFVVLVK